MSMDNITLFAKNEKELETLIHRVRMYCQDIEMEFGMLHGSNLLPIHYFPLTVGNSNV